MIGANTAKLISRWIMAEKIDISHLLLSQNNIGDAGVEVLAPALAMNQTIIAVDLS